MMNVPNPLVGRNLRGRLQVFLPNSPAARHRLAQLKQITPARVAAFPRANDDYPVVDLTVCLDSLMVPGGQPIRDLYRSWRNRANFSAVHAFVDDFAHRALYTQKVADIEDVCRNTDHSLGQISKRWLEAQKDYPAVRDFNTPFAMQYLFHAFLEDKGRLPLWQEVMPYLMREKPELYWNDFCRQLNFERSNQERRNVLLQAMQWRLGCAYYSFVREADILARLREQHKLDVRYHVLADVLFRVDMWCENAIVSLFVSNDQFRTASGQGRKTTVRDVFNKAEKPFVFVDMPRPKPRKFGVIDLVPEDDIATLAKQIRQAIS
jgi:hypothetical protein